jgi:hypothetical protein
MAVATALLAAACAQVPSEGLVQSTAAPQGGSGTTCCALVMSGPQPEMGPAEIVSGFLLASASQANRNAIAREYLTPSASRSWSPGSAVTIVDQQPSVVLQNRMTLAGTVTVVASGREVATLTSSGQYKPVKPVTGGGTAGQLNFGVERVDGQWRIDTLPGRHVLLLPEWLFNLVYRPQNLYFYAHGQAGGMLVPDPVFVPSDSSDPATRLVSALLNGVPNWLDGAAVSAFPPHSRLQGVQVLPGPPSSKTAIVSLSLPPQAVRPAALRALDAQLVWTLTSHSYGDPLVGAVKLKVNGRFWPASGSAVLGQSDYWHKIPHTTAGEPLYYLGADGKVRVLGQPGHGADESSTTVPGAAGQGRVPLADIAVSPDHGSLAGVGTDGRTVYVSDLAAAALPHAKAAAGALQPRLTGSGFTTPSWDSAGDLWVTGRSGGSAGVWVLPSGGGPPVRVGLPTGLGPVTGLRVAPDGARLAMIVGQGPAAHLVIGAIVRAGNQFSIWSTLPVGPNVSGVSALAWYDGDHLMAVSGTAAAMQVWEVPVNGQNAARQGGQQPGIVSVAAAGPQNPLYLGLASGRLERSAGFGEFWSDLLAGRSATYPG